MPKDSDSIFHSDEAGGHSPAFSDLSFQNERAMWWAEFDSIGEEAVRGYVERNSYTPTGMEVARQWLARREFLQLRGDVQSIRALAEQAQGTASESLRSASEALTLASRVDANSRAIVEMAATAKKTARTMVLVGTLASLFALCAIVMVLASSRQVAPNTKQTATQPSRAKQPVVRPLPPRVPPAETRQAPAIPPENVQKTQPPNAAPIDFPDLKPEGQSLAETRQAPASPPESAQKEQPSNAPQIKSADLKPEGQSLAGALALIADKVGGEGTINFTAQFHDMATGRDHTEQLSYRASNVTIDPNRCQVGYRWHVEQDGRAVSDENRTVELRLAKNIRVTSMDAEAGRRFSMRTYPTVYVVHIARWDNASGDNLYFHDKDMAERVGTATRHAVELCDKGEQQFRRR
ncbi:MAG: hypothetical protein H7X89_12940 [Rhizobiales bacterium]|nr:hypothetical protein [Hyphomicrobiales bacterium]